jgi:hypothetical protein
MPEPRRQGRQPDSWSHPILMCGPSSIAYDFARREGSLKAPPMHCPDMSGCIRVFECIDSEVEKILCYEGDRLDVVYRRIPKGKGAAAWVCVSA